MPQRVLYSISRGLDRTGSYLSVELRSFVDMRMRIMQTISGMESLSAVGVSPLPEDSFRGLLRNSDVCLVPRWNPSTMLHRLLARKLYGFMLSSRRYLQHCQFRRKLFG